MQCRGILDLVKSHLMFAVREEVEVLREQIKELAERNAALEWENGLLRSLASPEQLAQLRRPTLQGPHRTGVATNTARALGDRMEPGLLGSLPGSGRGVGSSGSEQGDCGH
uniref:TSC22 domain family protein 4 n=1 Tax=Chrysemys picta bellii TaxID=8478 RepID=A0A8C3P859_CHRPI